MEEIAVFLIMIVLAMFLFDDRHTPKFLQRWYQNNGLGTQDSAHENEKQSGESNTES